MEQKLSCQFSHRPHSDGGRHECEIFRRGLEVDVESEMTWNECEKNPGHKEFVSAQDFKDNYLPRIQNVGEREKLRAMMDLTVRLRVSLTSLGRPDHDEFAEWRGSDKLRLGTGYIYDVIDPKYNEHNCPCHLCGGKGTRTFWQFIVYTAHHVVYDTAEAKETKVDFYFDDENCQQEGRMKSVMGVRVDWSYPDRDVCFMSCVTHDEDLVKRIESALRCLLDDGKVKHLDLSRLDFLPSCDRGRYPALIVSHPHGKTKKITMGQVTYEGEVGEDPLVKYNTPTCPGSSGATVLVFNPELKGFTYLWWLYRPVHSGSDGRTPEQINYGHRW